VTDEVWTEGDDLYFRRDSRYAVVGPLGGIGWTPLKFPLAAQGQPAMSLLARLLRGVIPPPPRSTV
jgi:hypothetical protein